MPENDIVQLFKGRPDQV